MAYLTIVNEIKDAIYNLIVAGNIKNLNNVNLTVYKRAIPEDFSQEDCPMASVFKSEVSGAELATDQYDVELPRSIKISIGLSDFSLVDLDDAEKLTDDLIEKVLTRLLTDPNLSGKSKGISVSRIVFNEDRREGVWFSEPTIELEVVGTTL